MLEAFFFLVDFTPGQIPTELWPLAAFSVIS